jgi:hypothetical protein
VAPQQIKNWKLKATKLDQDKSSKGLSQQEKRKGSQVARSGPSRARGKREITEMVK